MLQIVVIITVMFAFVSMVAGIFGQNLHFGSVETGTVSFLKHLLPRRHSMKPT